jgi:hypothetical protein
MHLLSYMKHLSHLISRLRPYPNARSLKVRSLEPEILQAFLPLIQPTDSDSKMPTHHPVQPLRLLAPIYFSRYRS